MPDDWATTWQLPVGDVYACSRLAAPTLSFSAGRAEKSLRKLTGADAKKRAEISLRKLTGADAKKRAARDRAVSEVASLGEQITVRIKR